MMQRHFEMPAAGRAARAAGTAALACCLLLASGVVLLANPLQGTPASRPDGKADRLAIEAPELSAAVPAPSFVTVARRHGASVTVLEKVAVAH